MASELEASRVLADETLEVRPEGRLVIDAWAGSVRVGADGEGPLRIAVRGRGLVPAPVLEIARDGEDVFVDVRCAPLWRWLPVRVWRSIRVEVRVPARFSVDVQTRGGCVEIRGIEGEVDATSRRGRLVFRDVRGPIDAHSAAGSIEVCGCRGDVDAATARGSIEIEGVMGQVSAHTGSGRILVRDPRGEVLLRSGGGSLQLEGGRRHALGFA
jgi:hypothetical protein